jgi:hypothetical protein
MNPKWIDGPVYEKYISEEKKGILVVIPKFESEDMTKQACEKILALLSKIGKNLLELRGFSLGLEGNEGEETLPVFFIREETYLMGERDNYLGLVRVVPLGRPGRSLPGPVVSDKKGPVGAETLSEEFLQHLIMKTWFSGRKKEEPEEESREEPSEETDFTD